jgi:hypothetical protein
MIMQLKLMMLLVSSLLVVSMAHAQFDEVDKVLIQRNLELKENYSSICTSLNGVEFSSMPKPNISAQAILDGTGDCGIVHIPSGYYYLDKPL